MNIKRKELQAALQRCLPGVESGATLLTGADSFIFKDGMIHSYNDNISVSVPFIIPMDEGALEGAVKAKEFYAIVSKLPSDEIKLAINEGSWSLKSGAASVELTLLESSVLEHVHGITTDAAWFPLPANFLSALQRCKFGCNRSAMSGIYVNGKYMMSTDEMRINQFQMDADVEPFWIADPQAGELMKLNGLIEYRLIDSWAQFRTGDGTAFSCKRLQHNKFPFEKILNLIKAHAKEETDLAFVLPAKLVESVERAASFAMDIDSFSAIRLTFNKANIEVHSEKATGKFTEKVPWDKPVEHEFEPIIVYMPYQSIGYGVLRSTNIYIKQTARGESVIKRLVFQGENLVHLVSTVNPS